MDPTHHQISVSNTYPPPFFFCFFFLRYLQKAEHFLVLKVYLFVRMSAVCMSVCMPTGHRWLWDAMWLPRLELGTSGRASLFSLEGCAFVSVSRRSFIPSPGWLGLLPLAFLSNKLNVKKFCHFPPRFHPIWIWVRVCSWAWSPEHSHVGLRTLRLFLRAGHDT